MKTLMTFAGLSLVVATACTGLFACPTVNASNYEDYDDIYADTICVDTAAVDYEYADTAEVDYSKNDIRFDGWTDKEWLDNDYIRSFRQLLDNYLAGNEEQEELDPYRDKITGKFIVYTIEPYFLGGVWLDVVFVDYPDLMISSWVYSYIEDGVVSLYVPTIIEATDCAGLGLTTEMINEAVELGYLVW